MTILPKRVTELDASHLPDGLLSVVVFGPGSGESIVLRFPDGRVAVVDGCRARAQQVDPAHALLSALNVKRLFFACLTHPHQDHFGGLAELVKEFSAEHLLWAGTEHARLLQNFVASFRKHQALGDSISDGISPKELDQLVKELARATQRRGRQAASARAQCLADHKLLFTLECNPNLEIWGVLPTTTALHRALGKNASVPTKANDQEPFVSGTVDPNDISGALFIRWGRAGVLLGGDVLTGRKSHHEGWSCADWITGPAQVIKVPHHASEGAHCQELWDRLNPQVAIVTPFESARGTQPPQEPMLRVLASQTEYLTVTSRPAWWPGNKMLVADGKWPSPPRVSGTPLPGATAPNRRYGAVSVSLDSTGVVKRLVLAGGARRVRVDKAKTKSLT